jgi:hypothetical protein
LPSIFEQFSRNDGGIAPSRFFVRQLLADKVLTSSLMVDVEKVSWHVGKIRSLEYCSCLTFDGRRQILIRPAQWLAKLAACFVILPQWIRLRIRQGAP